MSEAVHVCVAFLLRAFRSGDAQEGDPGTGRTGCCLSYLPCITPRIVKVGHVSSCVYPRIEFRETCLLCHVRSSLVRSQANNREYIYGYG
ncbi:hypothetical protein B0H66DRAFT_554716 [Apodospora peruviana]|uniref:Secreted protein n=1 Tax=Apodospora peruviana TaxID=516989 RepID=A0AAE0M7W5_9PEZI|nr:hypothetical protein B0H66DRAFT_554716 [Apodospora peruviana]